VTGSSVPEGSLLRRPFVHLDVHTEFSLVDSVIQIPDLIRKARELDMPAIAVTDQGNLFGAVKFFENAVAHGIKPLIGAEISLITDEARSPVEKIRVLCRSLDGYQNLCRLFDARAHPQEGIASPVRRDAIAEVSLDGLVILAGAESAVGRLTLQDREKEAQREIERWKRVAGSDFHLVVSRLGWPQEELLNARLCDLAERNGIPLVATNAVRFLTPDEYEAHEARVCIQQGWILNDPERERRYTEQQYLKSESEMEALFTDWGEALSNTLEVARRCNFEFAMDRVLLPAYPVAPEQGVEESLHQRALEGFNKRSERIRIRRGAAFLEQAYRERLERELDVIGRMGFSGYFLIVADFIDWARSQEIPVGPGRGSGAGSLVAYALGITDLDPLEHGLLFERFLNPERVTMPDFDVDFCIEGRDQVIRYVEDRYGRTQVAQIATFGTMAARAVVRDVVRVLGLPYGFADRLAKLIPFELHMTLDRALAEEPELKSWHDSDETVKTVVDLGRKLEGRVRSVGKHAGGVVIAPTALTDYLPLFQDTDSQGFVTQYDKDDLEHLGLVKFDFLGLTTLTIIDRTVRRIQSLQGQENFSLDQITMDDSATFRLLQSCETTAIFQLESRGMRDLIRRLKPDRFDDIVALVALFRPGPLQSGMVSDFINRKHGLAPITYLHPALKPVLADTYGVILYQEQVMQIAQDLAGYSLGAADLLRRAMGKKKPEEMAQQRSGFVSGAVLRKIPKQKAEEIFDLMEKFAGYGFNKSHSVAYALLAYQTAWLKAHFPAPFMASVLTAEMGHLEKLPPLLSDCTRRHLQILPPDINRSEFGFLVEGEGIRYGLGALKGVGQSFSESVVRTRALAPFADLEDFCQRMGPALNRRTFEALIKSGAFDGFGTSRTQLLSRINSLMALAEQYVRADQQNDFFGLPGAVRYEVDPGSQESSLGRAGYLEILEQEKEVLGLYLSGHPMELYRKEWSDLGLHPLSESLRHLETASTPLPLTAGGLLDSMRWKPDRGYGFLEDGTGRVEVVLFGEDLVKASRKIPPNAPVVVQGLFGFDEFAGDWRFRVKGIELYDRWRAENCRLLVLSWNARAKRGHFPGQRVIELLQKHRGGTTGLRICYTTQGSQAVLRPREEPGIMLASDLVDALRDLLGGESIRLLPGKKPPAQGGKSLDSQNEAKAATRGRVSSH
jgi:DNA polymerase-3 subunit alpha